MSIDLNIIPTESKIFTWRQIRTQMLQDFVDKSIYDVAMPLSLYKTGTEIPIDESTIIGFNELFRIRLQTVSSLSILCKPIESSWSLQDAYEYLLYVGDANSHHDREEIARLWKSAGFYFVLNSTASRARYEAKIMMSLACSLASLYKGYITFDGLYFDQAAGLYSAEEFKNIRPKF